MKELILVRHAKSSWEYDVIDHERPLKKRGFNDANLVSNHLKNENFNIDLVISSDAVRAKTTAEIFIENLNISNDIVQFEHNLYDFSGELLTQVIKNCNDAVDRLMVFGHNHAITAFVNTFGDKYIVNVPTTGTVILQFDINSWDDLKLGKTIMTIFPKDLK
ncbi:SixA phosphatase family protein [Tamlana crocina]|uniref:Histidine phosphatase family protein n=1 Tax=Tamlana crocina TaxID=393006 RepID=A0ABX1DAR0_9FLAO|nr:histidine phosphatase family protein [Tamlana crocina]NJX15443.1 histidine phosphatase family protein [Tamlana crocina]